MYLVRKKSAKTAHLWTGFDTVCRMYTTGGLRKKAYMAVYQSDLPICHMCTQNKRKELRPAGPAPALRGDAYLLQTATAETMRKLGKKTPGMPNRSSAHRFSEMEIQAAVDAKMADEKS